MYLYPYMVNKQSPCIYSHKKGLFLQTVINSLFRLQRTQVRLIKQGCHDSFEILSCNSSIPTQRLMDNMVPYGQVQTGSEKPQGDMWWTKQLMWKIDASILFGTYFCFSSYFVVDNQALWYFFCYLLKIAYNRIVLCNQNDYNIILLSTCTDGIM